MVLGLYINIRAQLWVIDTNILYTLLVVLHGTNSSAKLLEITNINNNDDFLATCHSKK